MNHKKYNDDVLLFFVLDFLALFRNFFSSSFLPFHFSCVSLPPSLNSHNFPLAHFPTNLLPSLTFAFVEFFLLCIFFLYFLYFSAFAAPRQFFFLLLRTFSLASKMLYPYVLCDDYMTYKVKLFPLFASNLLLVVEDGGARRESLN